MKISDLKTSYYARAFRLPRDQFFIVRISIGAPRGGKCDAFMPELAPTWAMLNAGYGKEEYFPMLGAVGLPAIKRRLAELRTQAAGREVLLCCFESLSPDKVAEGQWCHRRYFADWWWSHTGETINEFSPLGAAKDGAVKPSKTKRTKTK